MNKRVLAEPSGDVSWQSRLAELPELTLCLTVKLRLNYVRAAVISFCCNLPFKVVQYCKVAIHFNNITFNMLSYTEFKRSVKNKPGIKIYV